MMQQLFSPLSPFRLDIKCPDLQKAYEDEEKRTEMVRDFVSKVGKITKTDDKTWTYDP